MSLKVTALTWLLKLVCPAPVRTTPEQQPEPGSGPAGRPPSRSAGLPTCAGLLQLGRHFEAVHVRVLVRGEPTHIDGLGGAAALVRLESQGEH